MIASACDHFTRVSTGGSRLPKEAPVYGLLFGMWTDGNVSVCDSVDINYSCSFSSQGGSAGEVLISTNEIVNKAKLWTAVFTSYKLIGWYAFGDALVAEHLYVHNEVCRCTAPSDPPILLLINQAPQAITADRESDSLPIKVFHPSSGSAEAIDNLSMFCETSFQMETSDIEKLSLEQIVKSVPVHGLSNLEVQNQSLLSSLTILDRKVAVIIDTLKSIQARGSSSSSSSTPADQMLLRTASKICLSLPPIDSDSFGRDFSTQVVDSSVVAVLSANTAMITQLNDLGDMYNSLYTNRGGKGLSRN